MRRARAERAIGRAWGAGSWARGRGAQLGARARGAAGARACGAGGGRQELGARGARGLGAGLTSWPGLCTRCTPLGFQLGFLTRYFS